MERTHTNLCALARLHGKAEPAKPDRLLELEERAARRKLRTIRGHSEPLERDVLKAVVDALRLDPRVARVERNQSGVFQDGSRYIRVGTRGKLDITVYLKDGRYIECEVKRSPNIRLLRPSQAQRIKEIRASGGLAGWCWNVESALALIP
jgi:hypothetical protein